MIALSDAKVGVVGVVRTSCDDPRDAALLRAMGLRPDAVIRVCRVGEPCIVEVLARDGCVGGCGCRIGLASPIAKQVKIGEIDAGTGPGGQCGSGGCPRQVF